MLLLFFEHIQRPLLDSLGTALLQSQSFFFPLKINVAANQDESTQMHIHQIYKAVDILPPLQWEAQEQQGPKLESSTCAYSKRVTIAYPSIQSHKGFTSVRFCRYQWVVPDKNKCPAMTNITLQWTWAIRVNSHSPLVSSFSHCWEEVGKYCGPSIIWPRLPQLQP